MMLRRELCRKEGIQPSIYYKWSKAFLDAGKNGLTQYTEEDLDGPESSLIDEEIRQCLRDLGIRQVDNGRLLKGTQRLLN
ncbi:hypothetical protein MYX65_13065 [Acidobacteria bacterium AH-259-L09]|nr:hypothetical protein [Acidobacteria bacterium AH-259-L09]